MANNTFLDKWGKETAKARYGGEGVRQNESVPGRTTKALVGLIDQPKLDETGRIMQTPQAINDRHDAGYDNETTGWVNGHGEPYPHFDHTKKRK
jgi:hypothetical protein